MRSCDNIVAAGVRAFRANHRASSRIPAQLDNHLTCQILGNTTPGRGPNDGCSPSSDRVPISSTPATSARCNRGRADSLWSWPVLCWPLGIAPVACWRTPHGDQSSAPADEPAERQGGVRRPRGTLRPSCTPPAMASPWGRISPARNWRKMMSARAKAEAQRRMVYLPPMRRRSRPSSGHGCASGGRRLHRRLHKPDRLPRRHPSRLRQPPPAEAHARSRPDRPPPPDRAHAQTDIGGVEVQQRCNGPRDHPGDG